MMHCRKNFLDLTEDERNRLADAFNMIQADGMIEEHAQHHDQYFFNGIHFGSAFLPWHRHMLFMIEQALQSADPTVMLPYWDWSRADDSQDLDAEPWKSYFGGRNGKGKFGTWNFTRDSSPSGQLPTLNDVLAKLQAATFADFRAMECGVHSAPHIWVGGTMAGSRSPRDPLFYLHHCNVDRLWAIWQLNHAAVAQYTLDSDGSCDSVAAAMVALSNPMVGGATPASMLDHKALGYFYHQDDRLSSMISGDVTAVQLETPQVIFNDVPEGDTTKRAALFQIAGCAILSFEVTNGPTGPFSLFEPGPFPYPAAAGFPTEALRIWVMYTGRTPGSVDTGVMTVLARNEFGDEVQRWENIPIFANSVARPKVAVSLVLDESGSMLYDAGNGRTRLQVLQLAATTFVDQLFDDNGLAMVSFANAADKLMDLQVAGDMASSVRGDARAQIIAHGPPDVYQHTCIGAGLQKAADIYATSVVAPDFSIKSTVVFTDGFEDRAPFISQVRSLINERVYAIGVADAANVQNDTLRALADDTGGYMLVTGAIQQDDQFLLEKFFIQVLAGVTNRDIVRDPDGWLIPNNVARVPFSITRSDISFDAIALSRAPRFLAIALQTPDGTVVGQTQVASGQFRTGNTASSFRIPLPLVIDGKEHWEGEWQLLLAIISLRDATLVSVPKSGFGQGLALPFHALMHARSNLHLHASLAQNALVPGSTINLRAIITEYGQRIETHPHVVATMTRPDQTTANISFAESGIGEFDASVAAIQSGVYRFYLQASGLSGRGQAFTREHLLTAVIGLPSQQPNPDSDGSNHEKLCEFLNCLMGKGVLTERLVRKLEELGIDLAQLRRCMLGICHPPDKTDGVIK
jgi:hypothetical protein